MAGIKKQLVSNFDEIEDTIPAYRAERTPARFHASDSFFRGLRGPLGSGKSVACAVEVMRRCLMQEPFKNVRRSRWAIIRNTYGELRTTTIRTWCDWYGAITRMSYGHPIMGFIEGELPDGTELQVELVFISLDRPDHVKKLKSLELTGVWMNEASELVEDVLQMATGRVNRYPSKMMGGPSWSGIIADTNSCNVDNWWYRLSQEEKPEHYEFFDQPAALIEKRQPDGSIEYLPNPEAENIRNHTAGYQYYFLQLPGKPKSWVDVFVMNRFGTPNEDNLVYPEYCEKNVTGVTFDPARDIIWAHDFNFTPLSSCIMQLDREMNVYAVDEIVLTSASAKMAAQEFCERYRDFKGIVYIYGDASGYAGERHGLGSDYTTIEQELRRQGFRIMMKVPRANPPIKAGQASLNAKICDAVNRRSFFVNKEKCKTLHKGLSALKLKAGSTFLEEDAVYQHITTAVRYFTAVEFPVRSKPTVAVSGTTALR